MGLHGAKSSHPSGSGHTTKKGYHRLYIWDAELKVERAIFAHVHEWEKVNGPIPAGFDIHHKDFDKQNNDIGNLELVSPMAHKRLHTGCELRDGAWWKTCSQCEQAKPVDGDNWYLAENGWIRNGMCKCCHIKKVSGHRSAKRAAARALKAAV